MTQKKDRDRVMAEITLSHLLRLATEQGCSVSREQALAFLNQQGRAFEMWKQMMQAGEDFIARSLFGLRIGPGCRSDGVSVHTFRTLLILTATLLWRQSVAVLRRVSIVLFQFRAYRYSKGLFSRINRLRAGSPRNNASLLKRYSETRQQL